MSHYVRKDTEGKAAYSNSQPANGAIRTFEFLVDLT